MAFDLDGQAYGYGDGSKGDWTPAAGNYTINAYAKVTDVTKTTITIADATTSSYSGFTVGTEILFHLINVDSDSYRSKIGGWRVCKITAVNGNVLTVKNRPSKLIKASLSHTTPQVVTIPTFKNVTLNSGVTIKPTPYANGRGGIVAFKCSGTLTFDGGHIDLTNAGLSSRRRLLKQEAEEGGYMSSTPRPYVCWENYATQKHFTLNGGDGSAFIICKKMVCHKDSRIGNPAAQGVAYQRGATDDHIFKNSPIGVLNNLTKDGGSTILIAAKNITNFNVKMFAKYRTDPDNGSANFGRCYIASETTLPLDEALYAFDRISTPARLADTFNIKDFGDGSDGIGDNVTKRLNNFARITKINKERTIVTIAAKITNGLAQWKVGALVMVHAMHKNGNVKYSGRFHIAHIIGIKGSNITLDAPIPDTSSLDLEHYNFQILTIPQYASFTLSDENNSTMAYNDEKLRGGIFAIAVSGTCDLRGGKINVENDGGGEPYGKNGLKYISNAGMSTRLPIGQGHGSVFILAKELIMDANTRIGATYSGANYGGYTTANLFTTNPPKYGYMGGQYNDFDSRTTAKSDDVYKYSHDAELDGERGSGGAAGTDSYKHSGGYGSNASGGTAQGAHIMIVADKITGFNIAAISTGGQTATKRHWKDAGTATPLHQHGGASYGGGGLNSVVERVVQTPKVKMTMAYASTGGFHFGGAGSGTESRYGDGGGASGFCFVYCNEVENQNTANTFID